MSRTILFLALAAVGCGYETEESASPPGIPPAKPVHLCLSGQTEDSFVFTATTGEDGGPECASDAKRFPFAVSKDVPRAVDVAGAPKTTYCLRMERHSGYVTISHARGTVTRNGDVFTWCITPREDGGSLHAGIERMVIRSLTARADITLAVP